jgi:hypothetical protein
VSQYQLGSFSIAIRTTSRGASPYGGPNFPHGKDQQAEFLRERPVLDAYVYLDGEVGFANFLAATFAAEGLPEARRYLKTRTMDGVVQLDERGLLTQTAKPLRITELDRLSPMIQTNRGCPFNARSALMERAWSAK